MHPITACGFERQSEELRVESEDKRRERITSLFTLHSPHSTLSCMHPIARALREREPKAKRELSATHAWTLGKREPKAKRAPSEQVYRLRY